MIRSWGPPAVESDSPARRAGRGLYRTDGESNHGIFFTCHPRWQGPHEVKRGMRPQLNNTFPYGSRKTRNIKKRQRCNALTPSLALRVGVVSNRGQYQYAPKCQEAHIPVSTWNSVHLIVA